MKKVIKLKESDIHKMVNKVIKEQRIGPPQEVRDQQKKIDKKDKVIHSELEKRVVELEERVELLSRLIEQNTQLSIELKKSIQEK